MENYNGNQQNYINHIDYAVNNLKTQLLSVDNINLINIDDNINKIIKYSVKIINNHNNFQKGGMFEWLFPNKSSTNQTNQLVSTINEKPIILKPKNDLSNLFLLHEKGLYKNMYILVTIKLPANIVKNLFCILKAPITPGEIEEAISDYIKKHDYYDLYDINKNKFNISQLINRNVQNNGRKKTFPENMDISHVKYDIIPLNNNIDTDSINVYQQQSVAKSDSTESATSPINKKSNNTIDVEILKGNFQSKQVINVLKYELKDEIYVSSCLFPSDLQTDIIKDRFGNIDKIVDGKTIILFTATTLP